MIGGGGGNVRKGDGCVGITGPLPEACGTGSRSDLAIRPIFHREERRVDVHIFIAFLAYCLQITLQRRLHALAPGLTAHSALEKFAASR